MTQETKTMLTVKDVSEMFKIHPLTIRKMCISGELPGVKIGRQWRFDPDILNRWMEEQTRANMSQQGVT